MARHYSAKTFLRNTPNDLLEKYFQNRGIDLGFRWDMLRDTEVNPIFVAMERLPEDVRSSIDSDFRMINDLACESGVLAILEQATLWDQDWATRFSKMKNAYERAFWTFLKDPEHVRIAGNFHEMDRRGGWRRRFVGEGLDACTNDDTLKTFTKELRCFFRKQGRGRFCHVDHYFRQAPRRHCYFAYPEDYASTELAYDEHGRFQQRARRSAFEIIFVYRPDDGMLELRAKGGKRELQPLEEAFCKTILGLPGVPDEDGHAPYDLAILKMADFPFLTDPCDRIAGVDVRQMRLELPGVRSRRPGGRITLSVRSRFQTPDALHRMLDEAINKKNFNLQDLTVSQAKLRFTFEPVNGDRPKTLTFDVTCPDRCTLKDDPHDQIAKKYLQEWGIARA